MLQNCILEYKGLMNSVLYVRNFLRRGLKTSSIYTQEI